MLISIFQMFIDLFGACAAWLGRLMEGAEMTPIWLGAVAVWTVYRFLLKPLFGVAGSDSARRKWISNSSSGSDSEG